MDAESLQGENEPLRGVQDALEKTSSLVETKKDPFKRSLWLQTSWSFDHHLYLQIPCTFFRQKFLDRCGLTVRASD